MRRRPGERRPVARPVAAVMSVVVLGLALVACAGPDLGSPSADPAAAPTASPTRATEPTGPPSAPILVTPSPSAPSVTGVPVDPALLGHLPDMVDGVAIEPDPDTSARVAADPALTFAAAGLMIALAAAETETADDLAIVSVVRLRPGIFSDAFFRAWRDSYDAAACDPAGGVSGHAEAEIAGRTTYIGTCAGGAHTYHVRLEGADDVVVSVTGVGERRLGEQVVAGLTE